MECAHDYDPDTLVCVWCGLGVSSAAASEAQGECKPTSGSIPPTGQTPEAPEANPDAPVGAGELAAVLDTPSGMWQPIPGMAVVLSEPPPCVAHEWSVVKGASTCKLCGERKADFGLRDPRAKVREVRPERADITPSSAGVIALKHLAYALLTGGYTPRQASAQLVKRHGFSRTAADRYVAAVLGELTSDEAQEPKETKRARLIASQYEVLRMAIERKQSFVQNGEIVTREDPDLRTANDAIKTLLALVPGGKGE